jgi:hypothetical protein
MTEVHAVAGTVVLLGGIAFAAVSAVTAILDRAPRWLEWLRATLVVALLGQAAIGGLLLVGGSEPSDQIHWLYGVVILAVPVLGGSFVADAPPRPKAAVYALAGVLVAVLAWRLAATG